MNVVFDFGVVLFTWEPDRFLPDYFPKRAATPLLAKALATDVFSHADWHAFDQGTVSSDEVIQRTSARLGLDASVLGQLVAAIPDLLTPVAGTLDILHRLARRRNQHQDIRLFYLSNMPAPIARVLEQRHDFLGVFDGGIFSRRSMTSCSVNLPCKRKKRFSSTTCSAMWRPPARVAGRPCSSSRPSNCTKTSSDCFRGF
jgi:putative hydrolase of the HAD superfamily